MGHSYGTLLRYTLVGHSCGTLLWDTLVGHSCGTLFWVTLVGSSCGALFWDRDTPRLHQPGTAEGVRACKIGWIELSFMGRYPLSCMALVKLSETLQNLAWYFVSTLYKIG